MRIALVRMESDASSEPYIKFEKFGLVKFKCVSVTSDQKYAWKLAELLALFGNGVRARRLSVDLVHSHFGPDAQFGGAIAKSLRVPHVISLHGYDVCYSRFRLIKLKRLRFISYAIRRRRLLRSADLLLCCSEFLRQRVIKLGVDAARTRVHYLGVDLELISAALEGLQVREAPVPVRIICVGRLVPIKGQDSLIRAIPAIKKRIPSLQVSFVGDGPQLRPLKQLAERLGVDSDVQFLGAKSHIETLEAMAAANVVVVPSRRIGSVEEAFGLAAAEAMALGVPVIATATGGLVELLEGGRLGRLVPENSSADLAKAVVDVVLGKSQPNIQVAREVVASKYDAKKQLIKLEEFFDELLYVAR